MALKSRLELEVDGRPAEQQIIAVRKALEGLNEVGVRTGPILSGALSGLSGSSQSTKAAAAAVQALQRALDALNASGSKAGSSVSGAASSITGAGSSAAAAEARLAAARRAMDELSASAGRNSAAMAGAGNAMNTASRNSANAGSQVGALNGQMGGLATTARSLLGTLLAVFGASQGFSQIYQSAEAYAALSNRMKLVTSSAGELEAAQKAVFDIAQSSYQPLSATAELFQRIATNQRELGLSGEGVAGIVGTISKSLAVSGASAASANAALIQLGQAFASGTLRGEELNSVMEQAPALAQAIAAGMGKTVGELRTLGQAGLLTAEAVVKALQDQESAVDALFNKTAVTIGNSAVATSNSLTQLIGKLDQASGASAKISAEIISVAKYMDSLTASGSRMQETLNSVGTALNVIGAGALTLVTAKTLLAVKAIGSSIYAYYANRTAAIAAAEAEVNKSQADVISARTALALTQAQAALYRGTILQTVTVGRLAEAHLAETAAKTAATAATNSLSAAQGALLGIQGGLIGRIGGLLGVLGGPVGLAVTVATVVGAYLLFKDSSKQATESLIDQNLALNETREQFKALSAEQKRYQEIEWAAKQKEAAEAASKAMQDFTRGGSKALSVYGYETNQYRDKFLAMLDEVRGGTRSLDSVTQWARDNTSITSEQVAKLAQVASEYSTSSQLAQSYSEKLGIATGQTDAMARSSQALSEAHVDVGKQTRGQAGETDKLIAKMKEEVALYGASEKAIAAYNATKYNMTAEQKEEVRVLGGIKDAQEAYKKAVQDNDRVQQEAARKQLIALFAQQQAAEDVSAALKKTQDEAAKAAEESAKRQITAIEKVAAASYASLLVASKNQQSLAGYSLLTNGGTPPAPTPAPRKTPEQLAVERLAQINETVSPNNSTLTPKTVREDAGQKLLDSARQRYAVLQQQSREIEAQGSSSRTLGAEAKKLIELETEIANLKEKKTLTAAQKQVLAMAELNLAQQKQNAALERANELTKERFENEAKLKAFRENLTSQNDLAKEGLDNELAGVGLGDRARERLQEDLKIRQDYQKQMDKLNRDYNKLDNPTANDTSLYESETQALQAALATRMSLQQGYYTQQDAMRGEWLLGVSDSWQNYVDMATDYNQQARDATASVLSEMTSSISASIQGLINGTITLGEAFRNLGSVMFNAVVGALADIGAQWLVTHALKMAGITAETTAVVASEGTKATAKVTADGIAQASSLSTIATTLAANVAAAVETLASWAPAALVASIGSFGAAAVVGGAALIAAYAVIRGVSGGFSEGGYTGAGGKYEPAGVVHKGEVVWSQADISRFGGVASVEALRKGNVTPIRSSSTSSSTPASSSRPGGTQAGGTVVNLFEDASKAGTSQSRTEDGQNFIDVWVANIMGDGPAHNAMQAKYGLQGQGS